MHDYVCECVRVRVWVCVLVRVCVRASVHLCLRLHVCVCLGLCVSVCGLWSSSIRKRDCCKALDKKKVNQDH